MEGSRDDRGFARRYNITLYLILTFFVGNLLKILLFVHPKKYVFGACCGPARLCAGCWGFRVGSEDAVSAPEKADILVGNTDAVQVNEQARGLWSGGTGGAQRRRGRGTGESRGSDSEGPGPVTGWGSRG